MVGGRKRQNSGAGGKCLDTKKGLCLLTRDACEYVASEAPPHDLETATSSLVSSLVLL